MGGPLSVVFSDIYMTKLEKDAILPPRKPILYKRFVDDIFTRRKLMSLNQLLEFLNNYHLNINPNKAGLFEGSFFSEGGGVNLTPSPPFIFQDELI